ncbi:MAG: Ig-like domain-containing protein [Synergistaceae bacterium]|nr:Ig-like domain-containing protein [Synergistaceae bacterium]
MGGTVEFIGSTFSNNSATGAGGSGGAVNVANGFVTFNGGTFAGNAATGDGGALYFGVAPQALRGTLNFRENKAIDGGAVYFGVRATVGGGDFRNNSARGNGGAIYADGALTVSSGDFTGNTAEIGGGAVYGTSVTVSDGMFEKNEANGTTGNGNGGAVGSAGTVNVSGGTFTGNTATNTGGAIYGTTSVTISNGTFNTNKAATTGGAVGCAGPVAVSGGSFSRNEATDNGGAVSAGTGTSTFSGGAFSDNKAGGSGGAVHSAGVVRITGGSFSQNRAESPLDNHGGGAVFASGDIDIAPAESITFSNNTAQQDGGALYTPSALSARNAIFTKNTATGSGGATYSWGKSTFTNCVIGDPNLGNLAKESGGGVYAGDVVATETTFRGNQASGESGGGFGGAVYLLGAGTSEFDRCLFASNQSNRNGGALYLTGRGGGGTTERSTKFFNTVFESNYAAGGQGGAVSIQGDLVLFSSCTFTKNRTATTGDSAMGGAVHTSAGTFKFGNCTFVENEVGSGKGGALALDGNSTQNSVVFYCTFVGNVAGGGEGGAVYTSAQAIRFVASAFVDNTASFGADVFRESGTITSRGYNILGDYGAAGPSGPSANVNWAADPGVTAHDTDKYGSAYTKTLLFGSNQLDANESSIVVGSSLSATQILKTLATAPTSPEGSNPNPALDYMPGGNALNIFREYFTERNIDHTDARGVPRPIPSGGYSDVGAFESGEGVIPPPPPTGQLIAYVRMSGIPNTMVKIGQTCSLTALVYYRNGVSSGSEPVTWSSSNPRVASIDQYGNLVSLSQGTTRIGVSTAGLDVNNRHAEDFTDLDVSEEWSYTNIHPDVWKRLESFNGTMQQYAEQLYFTDEDPERVKSASFADAFKSAYGVTASQVSEFSNAGAVNFGSQSSYAGDNWVSVKPSISVSFGALSSGGGSLLPLKLTYSLSWKEVSDILGREATQIDNVTQLFGRLKLVFEDASGTVTPVLDADGEFGVAASSALSSGALSLTNGNNGLTLSAEILLSDVTAASDGKPRLIDGRLVVADGTPDGTAKGSIWLLKRSGGGGSVGGGDSGGGGCNAGAGFLPLGFLPSMLGVVWALKRRKV